MPRKVAVFFTTLFLFGVAIVVVQLQLKPFPIKKIDCRLDNQICPEELIAKIAPIKKESFLFSPLEEKIIGLNLNLYQLKSVTKHWPANIILNFSLRPNSYLLQTNHSDLLLVSESGSTQLAPENQTLPLIEIINWQDPVHKDSIEKNLHQLNLNLIQSLAKQKISYKSIQISNSQTIKIFLKENLIALAQAEKIEEQIAKLAIVLTKLDLKTIDLKIKTIDLRFNFPLLKRGEPTQS